MAIIKLAKLDSDYLETLLKEKHCCATTEESVCKHTNECLQAYKNPDDSVCKQTTNPVCKHTENEENCLQADNQNCMLADKNAVCKQTESMLTDSENCMQADTSTVCKQTNLVPNCMQADKRGSYQTSWRKEKLDALMVYLPKGSKATLQAVAREKGVSVSALVRDALSIYLD